MGVRTDGQCHHPLVQDCYQAIDRGLHVIYASCAPSHIKNQTCLAGVQLPVLVSDLDLECKLWLKIRLAPMCPYFGTISLAFVGAPIIKAQLLPYNRVRLMRIPILQVKALLRPG